VPHPHPSTIRPDAKADLLALIEWQHAPVLGADNLPPADVMAAAERTAERTEAREAREAQSRDA
jgi:hypothetical protein